MQLLLAKPTHRWWGLEVFPVLNVHLQRNLLYRLHFSLFRLIINRVDLLVSSIAVAYTQRHTTYHFNGNTHLIFYTFAEGVALYIGPYLVLQLLNNNSGAELPDWARFPAQSGNPSCSPRGLMQRPAARDARLGGKPGPIWQRCLRNKALAAFKSACYVFQIKEHILTLVLETEQGRPVKMTFVHF